MSELEVLKIKYSWAEITIRDLQERCRVMEETLEWYATAGETVGIEYDLGSRAKNALSAIRGTQEK